VHVVVPSERPAVEEALRRAVDERTSGPRTRRRDGGLRWVVHRAEPRFVAGQARAVLELLAGRDNLPVTAWEPEAVRGHRARPTLLSNAETFAHVGLLALEGSAAYRAHGTPEEPGTLLLTVHGLARRPRVVEVPHGARWTDVLPAGALGRPVLVGGYHGTWVAPGGLADLTVSRPVMSERGLALGAGVVLPLGEGDCPVRRTAELTAYLAGQSAQRCGPCLNGLPALAEAVARLDDGQPSADRIGELSRLVARRGACAHPDGTVRMVQSMMAAFPSDVLAHRDGECRFTDLTRRTGPADATGPIATIPLAVGR
jgi:NADH:ubiquinone oxidoreductase subunit F (NADH-binding)